ncbi:hypothetical protein A3F06_00765 [candidate division TM6 bacterium RIFCSPHIGHO2_12_FULL_36_22]|nr:MAG: hypothetical protein A3F06_00765 [candidate division TM6 bacterium RIFCSPHIGHO2_12_FULL_36_22]
MQIKKWCLLIILFSFFIVYPKVTEKKMSEIKQQLDAISQRNKSDNPAKTRATVLPLKTAQTAAVNKAAQQVVKKPKPEITETAPIPADDYLYHFYFTLNVDPKLVPEQVEGQFNILPRLVFSFLDEKGNLASPRFGEFFDISPGKSGYKIETTSRGPFYIRYVDSNIDGSIKDGKLFPIKMEEIILSKENQSRIPNLDLKGFGPFYVKPDEFETGYVISVDETPQSIETNPEGIFSHKNLRIARGQLED